MPTKMKPLLVVNNSERSKEVELVLRTEGISFDRWFLKEASPDFEPPLLITGRGIFSSNQVMAYARDIAVLLQGLEVSE